MHFLYVFILQFLYNSTCFERSFRSSSVHNLLYLQLCTNRANVSNRSVLRLVLRPNRKTVQSCKYSKS